jgi:hypothetical protein
MNISSNISSAVVGGSIKSSSRIQGRSTIQPSGDASVDYGDDVVFTGSATRKAGLPPNSIDVILNSDDAATEAVYLKNAILALPALVLRSQANLSFSQ